MHFGKLRLREATVLQACASVRPARRRHHHAGSVLAMMSFLGAMAMTIFAAIGMDTALGGSAHAATITVNSLADPGAPGICTLRDAINASNSSAAVNGCTAGTGDDTIMFSVTGTILLTGDLTVAQTLTIQGPATNPPSIVINGQNSVQLMINDGTLSIANLTLENGSTTSYGGAIDNEGTAVTVTNSVFANNTASLGGALDSDSLLQVTDCTFNDNSAETNGAEGGAIFNDGTTVIVGSTFNGNTAEFGGGAVESEEGSMTITNSTFFDNSSTTFAGGALDTFGTLVLTNSTFSGNSAPASAGGAAISFGETADVKGTIITASTGSNCTSAVADEGFNLDDDGTCGFSSGTTSAAKIALDSGGLGDHGGPTKTIALESTSSAIDKIPLADCTDQATPSNPLTADQRGYGRPAPSPQAQLCDIGAYEFGAVAPGTPTPTPSPTPTPTPSPTPTPVPPTPTPTPTPGPVTITSPAAGSTVSGVVTFACTNPGGTANLYIDDVFVAHSSFSWNTASFSSGRHNLLCNGYQSGVLIGHAIENVTVSNSAPTPTPTPSPTPTPTATPTPGTVTITGPAAGSIVSGVVTFTCTNPGGTANLYIDDVFVAHSSYSWHTTMFANGSHSLLCNGYRNGTLIGDATEKVTVRN
jgi:CSLREA domain-containing protein